jgi:hypothetical protein
MTRRAASVQARGQPWGNRLFWRPCARRSRARTDLEGECVAAEERAEGVSKPIRDLLARATNREYEVGPWGADDV